MVHFLRVMSIELSLCVFDARETSLCLHHDSESTPRDRKNLSFDLPTPANVSAAIDLGWFGGWLPVAPF
jgi:hypothetical protein